MDEVSERCDSDVYPMVRGVSVDHATIKRWAVRFLPLLKKVSRRHKRAVGVSWRMDGKCAAASDIRDGSRPSAIDLQR